MLRRRRILMFLLATLLWAPIGLKAGESDDSAKQEAAAEKGSKFIRVSRDSRDRPTTMETAIVRYEKPNAPGEAQVVVDLIGAIHVADQQYYQLLNQEFENYDVVLYELVAPEGTRIEKGERSGGAHPVGLLQDGMKEMLELDHQLQHIDYKKENLLHADMSPEQFSQSMSDRGESFLSMMFQMMGQAMAMQNQNAGRSSDADMLVALFSNDRALSLKRVMADQFQNMDGMMAALDGPEGSTIITERNKVAFEKLAEQIEAGKKKIGVFYGAGHLPDMERRLLADFGLERTGDRWLVAWDMRPSAAKKAAKDKKTEAEAESSDDAQEPAREAPAASAAP